MSSELKNTNKTQYWANYKTKNFYSTSPKHVTPYFKEDWHSRKMRSKRLALRRERRTALPLDIQGLLSPLGDVINGAKAGADTAVKLHNFVNSLSQTLAYSGSDFNDLPGNLLARIEDFSALIIGLSTAQNSMAYFSLLHLYIRTWYSKSVARFLWENVLNIHEASQAASDKLDVQSNIDFDDFLAFTRGAFNSWQEKKESPFARKITDVVSMLVACGFMGDTDLTEVKLGNLRLFKLRAFEKQMESTDFLEMVFDTLLFFIERGYHAIKEGDASLLFHSDKDSAFIDNEYSTLVAAMPLVDCGNLEGLEGEFANDQEFGERLDSLVFKVSSAHRALSPGPARNVLASKLTVLKKLQTSLILARKNSPIREKPYGVAIFGGSSVGKSTINSILMKIILAHNNFPSTKEYVVTLNDSDKYQSEYKGSHTGVTMDDHGNTKAEHYSESPCNKIIDFLNNVQKAALNPNVELKGNIMIRPKVVTLTTNVRHLMAHQFSNEPVSILRRFNIHLDVKLRPEYTDPETGGLDSSKMKKFIEDAWMIDVSRVKIVRATGNKTKDTYKFENILTGASLYDVLEFVKVNSETHFAQQRDLVKNVEAIYDMELCEHSFAPSECPLCLDTQCDYEFDSDADSSIDDDELPVSYEVDASIIPAETLPERMVDAVNHFYREKAKQKIDNVVDHFKSYVEVIKEHRGVALKATLVSLGVGIAAYSTLKLAKALLSLQRSDIQSSEHKVPEKLPTDVINPWKKVIPVELPKSKPSASTPADRLVSMLSHHIGHISITPLNGGATRRCVCVPIARNDWIVPAHMMLEGEMRVSVQTTKPDQLGKNFTEIVDEHSWVPLGADFVLLRLIKGGDVHNFSKYLLEDDFDLTSRMYGDLVYKDPQGCVSVERVALKEKKTFVSTYARFEGVDYNTKEATQPGLCMSPLVAVKSGGTILGFHLAGRNGTNYGVSGILTKPQYDRAFTELNLKNPLVCHSSGTFPTSKFDVDFTPEAEIDKRHSVRFLEGEGEQQPTVEVIGAHGLGTARFKSQVRKLPISEHVEEIMNLPRLHGPPNSKCINKHWSRDLTQMAHPQGDFIPRIWRKATRDFEGHVDKFFEKKPEMIELVHPYPKDYVLSGMDGVTSVDRVDLTTSMGWPINKAKKNFIEPVEKEVEGVTEPVDFTDPKFWEEVGRIKDVLASGERVFAVHRGNLKDEPTKYTKDKIRVFAGCEFVFTCVVREYFLPIVRLIQTNWKDFECAVGINAHSKQWGELYEHITKHGTTNMIAGDYKAFDKSATPQAMMSAFEILIKIAKRAGYTQEQINIMRGVATEICYPVYELNGVFVKIFGSNPSGHPLTVIINNLMNSLYLRYAFYAIFEGKEVPSFATVIALICYGDDNAMGVRDDYFDFNHTRIAEELAKVGITYTMAEKDADSVPFVGIEDISFLKRGFVWSNDLGAWMAPIEEASLSKSLHNYMKRKGVDLTPEEQSANALNNANMEFFYYGKEKFLERRAQLAEVAEAAGISDMVELATYADLVDRFKGSKMMRPVLEQNDVPLDCQCLVESDLIQMVKSEFGRKPIVEDQPLGCTSLGSPDLIFDFSDVRCMVCVETKVLDNRGSPSNKRAHKVRQQVRKYGQVVSVLRETETVLALTYTEHGYSFVAVYNYDLDRLQKLLAMLPLDDIESEKVLLN